jgi:uncharacterized membrane protein YdjX (TVP38/TMEM64 family)
MGDKAGNGKGKPKKFNSANTLKFVGLIVFIALIVICTIALFPYFKHLTTEEGRLELIDMIQGAGAFGVLICLGLQFVQVVVAFIPGEVVQIAVGAIYGPFAGTCILVLGALISSAFVFLVVRKLGAPFVEQMIGRNHEDKLRWLNDNKRLDLVVFILFIIPGLPKDLFTYLVPLTRMRAANFLILSTLARIPGIAISSYIGNAAIQGDYTQAIIVAVIAGGLGICGIVFNKHIMAFIDKVEHKLKR